MKKLFLLFVLTSVCITYAKNNENIKEEVANKSLDTENVAPALGMIKIQKGGTEYFKFDYIINGITRTAVYDESITVYDNGLNIYYEYNAWDHVKICNFRYLNNNPVPNGKLTIQVMYGCRNPTSIAGGIEFDMESENGLNVVVSN